MPTQTPPVETEPTPLLTYAEAGALLRVSAWAVGRLVKQGQLKAIQIGKAPRIRRAELDRFIAES